MKACLFCNIVSGKAPAKILYEDNRVLAFEDIRPQAPIHFLVIPKEHFNRLGVVAQEDAPLLGHLLYTARKMAQVKKIVEKGFRVVINSGQEGGETVSHLHLHVLGGRKMSWPPG